MKDELYRLFEEYKTNIFIETGSHLGEGIARAVLIGYKEIHSIEIQQKYYIECRNRFRSISNISLYLGDSLKVLPNILSQVNEPCTFWLDAHMSYVSRNCPTLEEIKLIGQHHIKTHTFIIDDMMDFGTKAHENITMEDLMIAILEINPDYTFLLESSQIANNVLVATVNKKPEQKVYTCQDEVDKQIELAKGAKVGIIELGVLHGETSARFCEANPNVRVFGVDPLIPDSMNPNLIGDARLIHKVANKYPNFVFIQEYSYNLIKHFDKKFDYLFIDASHHYEDVKRDFEDWFAKLEKGGIVSLHDSGIGRGGPDNWPGPSNLADELIKDPRVLYIDTVYSLTIFKKL
jgi:SAM-dependent methyltransferase